MAEIILSPVAGMIIQTLSSGAVKKIGALYSVEDNLKKLEDTMSSIRAVLVDAERQQTHNNQVRLWLDRLAEVVNEADDLVDEIATRGLRLGQRTNNVSKKVRVFFSRSNQVVFRSKLSSEISNIRKRLAAISTDRRDFRLEVATRPVRTIERETHSYVFEGNVIGRIEEKKRVLEMVMGDNTNEDTEEKVCVVSIFGMGGIGKTTLAQLVFNDESVQKCFDQKIWVCVSEDDFNVKVILRLVVGTLAGTSMKERDTLEELQKTLREKLYGKRYLLVLDDVWNEYPQKWEALMGVLSSCGDSGSRIVVTTRIISVANLVSQTSQTFRLGLLSDNESWSLFKNIALKHKQDQTESDTLEIGKEIVKRCRGIPLAIKMIASMLSVKDPKTEWPSFLKNELSTLPQQKNDILQTLRLSYDSLPSHLKHCFAYCKLFTKDYKIDVQTLIHLWVAQGFIHVSSDIDQSLEDIGYDYFLELLGRCFFQEEETDETMNKVVSCKMHDLVHDLAIQVAGKEYVVLLDPSDEKNITEKVSHVSSCVDYVPSSLLQARRLRSLLRPNKYLYDFSQLTIEGVVSNLKFLRMLDLHNSKIPVVPNSIGKLMHLRYLDLSYNKIASLPYSITKLLNLHTLKLNHCYSLRELPRDMKKLVNLRNLEFFTLYGQSISLPIGLSQLTNLQTLSYFKLSEDPGVSSHRSCNLGELKGLNNLKGNLEIIGLRSGVETTCANMNEKEHLRSLRLTWYNYKNVHYSSDEESDKESDEESDEERKRTLEGLSPHPNIKKLIVAGYDGARFSSWLSSLTNLVELKLKECSNVKRLSSLEPLCFLRKMSLTNCYQLNLIITDAIGEGYFPSSLQQLKLKRLPNFKEWKSQNNIENVSQGYSTSYFPCLTNLKIQDCPKLTSMPLYPNVKELKLECTSRIPFEQTVLMSIECPQISTFYPLTQANDLYLHCPNKTVVQHFQDWMRNLSSLEKLAVLGYPMPQYTSQYLNRAIHWEIIGCDGRGIPVKGCKCTWEIFSSIQKLLLIQVSALEYLTGPIQYIASLEELHIQSCEELEFTFGGKDSIKFEALAKLLTMVFESIQDLVALPEWLRRITTLQNLKVYDCRDLRTIPDWICEMSSLQELCIEHCHKIESLPGSMSRLVCLRTLVIINCPISFEGSDNPIKWEALTSLQTLKLGVMPQLITLPEGIQHITTLQTLVFAGCPNLTALPDWICKLSSLQGFSISSCPKIESLSELISSPTLKELLVVDCPILMERYGEENGRDWPKIKHLQCIMY